MFGGLGDLAGILKQAKTIQSRMGDMQQQLAAARFEGESGGGMVKAVVDGRGALLDIRIHPDAAKDVELLEDLVKGAVGVAAQKAQEGAKAIMAKLTGGLNIPGLTDMIGNVP